LEPVAVRRAFANGSLSTEAEGMDEEVAGGAGLVGSATVGPGDEVRRALDLTDLEPRVLDLQHGRSEEAQFVARVGGGIRVGSWKAKRPSGFKTRKNSAMNPRITSTVGRCCRTSAE
jgi:hypothetical protein